ncbi:MAG: DoxX-like family protein, partial [Proteobacteria bacterium]|nr:DoxX-like family protein [Pseudomonadota bacterium]
PAGPQDRWHARLVFLRPVLRIALGLFWLASGLITAFDPARSDAMLILDLAGFDGGWALAALWGGVAADVLLGGLVLIDRHVRLAGAGMIAVTAAYLGVLSLTIPELWLDPLGPLVKTLPIIPAVLVMMALEDDR